jgi:hypothetical protein
MAVKSALAREGQQAGFQQAGAYLQLCGHWDSRPNLGGLRVLVLATTESRAPDLVAVGAAGGMC